MNTSSTDNSNSKKESRGIHMVAIKLIIILQLFFATQITYAQTEQTYDEIVITLNVQRIGNVDVPAVIYEGAAYLSVKDVFDYLKIKNTSSSDNDSISGYIVNPQAIFLIDNYNSKINYRDKVFNLKRTDIIKTDGNLFLKTDLFGEVFGLDCKFDFRSLSVVMKSRIDLPALLEMQQQQMRQNISHLKGEKVADTIIERKFPMFALGTADWSAFATQGAEGFSFTRLSLNLGAIVAGGEATAYLNYVSNTPLDKNQQFYRWRYVNNDKKIIKQVSLGNVFVQTTSTVNAALNGIQITNTPTTYKKSFGSYTLSNKTDPDWTVELYVNNVLVNYTKADASGFFTFEVPVVYGSSLIKLRHVSPWGEERIVEELINIPYNFVPAKQFEYMVTAGVVSNELQSKFSRVNFSYGLNNRITIGGGVEYLSTLKEDRMPFINASFRVGSNIVFSGEHTHQVRSKGVLTYKLPSNLQLDVTYIKYDPYQTAITTNFLEERKAVLSFPFRRKKFSSFYRFTYNQITVPKDKMTNAEVLMSASFAGINANFTTSGFYSPSQKANVFSNLSLTFRLPKGFRLSPQIQYEYITKQLNSTKLEVEKRMFTQGFVNLSFEKFFASQTQVVNLGVRYNFSAVQTMFAVRQANKSQVFSQSARGSLMYTGKGSGIQATNQNAAGRGGLHVTAFLDVNSNGKRDAGEASAPGLKFNIRGGKITQNKKDTSTTVSGLEAYAKYFIEINKSCFDNIAWTIKNPSLSVTIEPNHFKVIEIPVTVVGEISGMVFMEDKTGRKGQGRMIVNIYDEKFNVVAKVLSEADGYYNYVGLAPGKYSVGIDEMQLKKLQITSAIKLPLIIKAISEGDVVTSLNILLKLPEAKDPQ